LIYIYDQILATKSSVKVLSMSLKGTVSQYKVNFYKKYTGTALSGLENFTWLLFMRGYGCYLFVVVVN